MLTIGALLLNSAVTYGGHDRGNGLDFGSLTDNVAWFLGDHPVDYCFEFDSNSVVSEEYVRAEFASALEKWRIYSQVRNQFIDVKFNFNLRESVQGCDGTEHLKIAMGEIPQEIAQQVPPSRRQGVIAFALPTLKQSDRHMLRSGVLWVNPEHKNVWQWPHRLHGIFLHELGHIYGNPHVAGTVMSEFFLVQLFDKNISEAQARVLNTNIDHQSQLVSCVPRCDLEFNGTLGFRNSVIDSVSFEKNVRKRFVSFFGREPVGRVWANLRVNTAEAGRVPYAAFRVSDDSGAFDLPIEIFWGAPTIVANAESLRFKAFGTSGGGKTMDLSGQPHLVSLYQGVVRLPSGRELNVQLAINGGEAPLMLTYLDDTELAGKSLKLRSVLFGPDNIWD
jgi:hypothetical protein